MSNPQHAALEMVAGFIRDIFAQGCTSEKPLFHFYFASQDEGSIYLNKEQGRSYRQTLRKLIDAFAKNEDISARTVEAALQRAIFHSIDPNSKRSDTPLEQRIKQAISELSKKLTVGKKTYCTYIPIGGIDVADFPLDFGDIRFLIYADTELSTLEGFRPPAFAHIESELRGRPCAAVDIEARDVTAAKALAFKNLRRLTDIINFFSGLMPPHTAWIYIRGDCEPVRFLIPSVEVGGERFHLNTEDSGPYPRLSLKTLLAFDDEYGVGLRHVLRLLKNERSKMEKHIIAALQWAGRATIETRREEAFLLLAIALESLLITETNPGELTYRLKIRVAHLLGKDSDSRSELSKTVGKLYDIRSKIVHDGSFQVTDIDLNSIRSITQRCILSLCTGEEFKRMSNPVELASWFDARILS